MAKHGIGGRVRRVVLGGALAALLALGAMGVAGDPSQWGRGAAVSEDTAFNFSKIEHTAFNFSKIEF
jgi:hypothetical protein